MKTEKCIIGCKHFTGGEVKHHKDCPYYNESLSKIYDDLKSKVEAISDEKAKSLDAYIRAKHTQEECIGFIDGFEKAIELLKQ